MSSLLKQEALSAPDVVQFQGETTSEALRDLCAAYHQCPPGYLITIARGSSDHAAAYFAYLAMLKLKRPVLSLPPSLMTLHQTQFPVQKQWAFAISQSGASPDLITSISQLRQQGARTVSLTNLPHSALEQVAEWHIPLCAGIEQSVAASKSFIASLTATARFVAYASDDASLINALQTLPEKLKAACNNPWQTAITTLKSADKAYVIGRGLGETIARECALKLKETCGIQAEAFSSAEVRHGPMQVIQPGYPVLVLALRGPEQADCLRFAGDMRERGAQVLLAAPEDIADRDLDLICTDDLHLDPVTAIQSFYLMVESLAIARGMNPDAPAYLKKITKTV
ncbi:SIS domain-containing protein [Undibacterium luofuense]|uniref:SIS domain-containing protein n=1 Tax=Undibacterium luofuense TaxID=2828733 RepID=A0A941I6P7_9BURK|nr:SIS domain-containing protein [Undibacterium luofuense]MBR7781810.1 SIS domain-containing protein [Undibacterium luofuense]